MSKFLSLWKVQLLGMFGLNRLLHSHDKKEKARLVGMGVLILFVILVFAGYSTLFCYGLTAIGLSQMLPVLFCAVCAVYTFMMTLIKVNGVLFGFRDYEMVMAYPVKTFHVVASRLFPIYLMNLLVSLFMLIPASVFCGITLLPDASFWIMTILFLFLAPFLPMTIAVAAGVLVSAISARFRRQNLVSAILAVGAVLLLMAGSFALGGKTETELVNLANSMMQSVRGLYPPALWLQKALLDGDWLSFLLFSGVSIIGAFLCLFLLARFYKQIYSALQARHSKSNYKLGQLQSASPFRALYRKEIRCLFSYTGYLLNTCLCLILLLAAGVAMQFFDPAQIEELLAIPGFASQSGVLTPYIMGFFLVISCTTCSSISLEGKGRWLMQTAPVPERVVFQAKIAVNLTTLLPVSLISSTLFAIALRPDFTQALLLFLMPAGYALWTAVFGLFINLKLPKYDWMSVYEVVKRSAAMIVYVVVCIVITFIPGTATVFLLPYGKAVMAGFTVLLFVGSALVYGMVSRKRLQD